MVNLNIQALATCGPTWTCEKQPMQRMRSTKLQPSQQSEMLVQIWFDTATSPGERKAKHQWKKSPPRPPNNKQYNDRIMATLHNLKPWWFILLMLLCNTLSQQGHLGPTLGPNLKNVQSQHPGTACWSPTCKCGKMSSKKQHPQNVNKITH